MSSETKVSRESLVGQQGGAVAVNTDAEDTVILENLKDYLKTICPTILNIPQYYIETQLDTTASIQSISEFVSNPETNALFAVKSDSDYAIDSSIGT